MTNSPSQTAAPAQTPAEATAPVAPVAPVPAPASATPDDRAAGAPGGSHTVAARAVRLIHRVTPWLLGAALLAFLLPFVAVSCTTPAGYGSAGGGVTATYAGLTLATGGEPALDPADRPLPAGATRDEDRIGPQPAAGAALALAAIALAVALFAGARPRPLTVAALAVGSVALLGVAVAELDRQRTGRIVAKLASLGVPPRSPDDVAAYVQPDRGLWIAVGLLLAAAALNVGAALVRRRAGPLADPRRSGDQGGAVA